ncbi:MAG: hypothetical protein EOP85_05890 [Verrucomicrobiaceae bacterium]|nr:MAG: hypothetical protein EOP85_05890 [Verrucomicrobiaceae bacterium]
MTAQSPAPHSASTAIRLTPICHLAALVSLASAALLQQSHASTTITGITIPFGLGSSASSGTITRVTGSGAGVNQGTPASTSWFSNYNITGLDLSGDGTANDSISFRLNASAILGPAAQAGSARTWQTFSSYISIAHSGTSSVNRQTQWDGDGIKFEMLAPTITLGDANEGISISNFALTGIGIANWNLEGEQVALNGVTHTFTTGASPSLTAATPSTTMSIVNVGGAGNPASSSAFITHSMAYTLTVIPEPSMFTLCGVMALGAIFRRSRR